VTDLNALKDERRNWSDHDIVERMIGDGPQLAVFTQQFSPKGEGDFSLPSLVAG
jgi:hypothetical protein